MPSHGIQSVDGGRSSMPQTHSKIKMSMVTPAHWPIRTTRTRAHISLSYSFNIKKHSEFRMLMELLNGTLY